MNFIKDLSVDKVLNLAEDTFNQVKPKTDVEARVYEVLSHKNWGSSSTILNQIARDSYDYDKFPIVTGIMWEALETQRPSAWRVVFKGLTLLEHLIKNGSERCVDDARNHSHTLRGLHRFNYYEGTIDRGVGVREKSKQLVEILGDDERIREERQKARKMREKFGTSGGGGMAAVGGGGGNKYAGYGNDDNQWSSGGGGGGGGYGDSGIGSQSGGGGGYGDDGGSSKYGGRYADGGIDSTSASASVGQDTPTFAALPETGERIKKKKKKKKKKADVATMESDGGAPAATPAEPEVDLFDLGAPDAAPAPAAPSGGDDSFDAFQTAGPTSDAFGGADPFAAPTPAAAAPVPAAPIPTQQQGVQFDAFSNGNVAAAPNVNAVNDAFGNMNMAQQPQGMNGMAQQPQMNGTSGSNAEDDDDFGDFGGALSAPSPAAVTVTKTQDPLSGLINLDGLQKNVKKTSNLNNPVVSGDAASQYMQYQQQMAAQGNAQNIGAQVSFHGIDGLNTMPTDFLPKGARQNNRQPGQPIMADQQQGGMMNAGQGGGVSTGGSDAISSMFAPQQQGQQGGQMMGGGGMQGQQQQQQQQQMGMGMGMGQQQMGGMQGSNMMMNQQGNNMMNGGMGMQGGMGQMNPGMMQGNMGQMQNQGMMNQMGGQGFGGQGQMGGMGMGNQFQ